MKPWLAVAVTLLVSLSGCADADAGPPAQAHRAAAAAVGVLEGLVVDERVRPVAGASVELVGHANTTSNADGGFSFAGLAPGSYTLVASHPLYDKTSASSQVTADGARVTLVLPTLPGNSPYLEVAKQEGYLQCYASWQSPAYTAGFAACGAVAFVTGVDVDRYIASWDLEFPFDGWNGTVVELFWEPTTDVGRALKASLGLHCYYEKALGSAAGDGPLGFVVNRTRIDEVIDGALAYDDPVANEDAVCGNRGATRAAEACLAGSCVLRTTVSPVPGFTGSDVDVAAAIQQPFEIFITTFIHAPPPEGYSVAG